MADDRAVARAQRARAARAIAEAETALERLEAARARAQRLLRGTGRPTAPDDGAVVPPEEALRRRIRRIEDRMQRTDSLMRRVEESRTEEASPRDAEPER